LPRLNFKSLLETAGFFITSFKFLPTAAKPKFKF
jgi:hypothetical protein